MGEWCEEDTDCGNDELVCNADNLCFGNECTVDEAGVSTGCNGRSNCYNGFC